jgi:hypothetical protein
MTKAKELRETYVQKHQYTETFKPKYALKTNSDNRNLGYILYKSVNGLTKRKEYHS